MRIALYPKQEFRRNQNRLERQLNGAFESGAVFHRALRQLHETVAPAGRRGTAERPPEQLREQPPHARPPGLFRVGRTNHDPAMAFRQRTRSGIERPADFEIIDPKPPLVVLEIRIHRLSVRIDKTQPNGVRSGCDAPRDPLAAVEAVGGLDRLGRDPLPVERHRHDSRRRRGDIVEVPAVVRRAQPPVHGAE